MILVTHNLGIVAELADRVAVMYAGNLVELAPTADVLRRPAHPYTKALLSAVPELGRRGGRLNTIPGVVPRPGDYPAGCRFSPRCPAIASAAEADKARCRDVPPPVVSVASGHLCRCHLTGVREK